jgi:hypothetical protein
MAIQDRSALKNIFKTGAKPTQQNFADLFDSYWHMNDGVATRDWSNDSFIHNNTSETQVAGFRINGTGRMGEIMLDNGNVSQPDIIHFGSSGITNIYRSAGGLDMNYNGFYHIFSGIWLRLPNKDEDGSWSPGAVYFNTVTNKFRAYHTAWTNIATEDWVQANSIQANQGTQMANFSLNGLGNFVGNYTGGLSVKYDHEGLPFSWAWYHNITPAGHFSGLNNGGSGTPGPSVYNAANSFVYGRMSFQDPVGYFNSVLQPLNLGLRNTYETLGYEAVTSAEESWVITSAGGFFAATNDRMGGRGFVHMIGSEHVVKNTEASLSAPGMQLIGMRAIADLNIDSDGGGVLAAGYFKATNGGAAKVYAIYSDGGSNYLKDGVETDAPSARGSATWKLGKLMANGDAETQYIPYVELSVDGQLVKLAIMQ